MNNAWQWQVIGLGEREWPEGYCADNILRKGPPDASAFEETWKCGEWLIK